MVDTNTFLPYDRYVSDIHLFTFTFSPFSSIIYPIIHLFLRRHVAIPASGRNISYVGTQERPTAGTAFFTTAGTTCYNCRDNYCISPKNVVSLHRQ